MARRCFLGCEGTSPLYGLPKAEPSRSRWLDFIFNPIPPTLPSLFLCRLHFTDGCFSNLREDDSQHVSKPILIITKVAVLCAI